MKMPKKIVIKDHKIGYERKGKLVEPPLANFAVKIEKQVTYSPELPSVLPSAHYKGFIVRVTHQRRGKHGVCRISEG